MLSVKIFINNRKYFAPAFLYTCFSLVFSTWVIYIPFIAEKMQITEGKVGGALFFTSLGSFLTIPLSNKLIDILGVGRQAFIGFVLYAISMYGMFLASDYVWLCTALFLFGVMSSIFAISLNSLVATIEKQAGKYIMTGSHGFWSIGGIIGASTGGFIAGKLDMPLVHISILIAILIGLQIWLRKEYTHIRSEPRLKGDKHKFSVKPLIAIASIAMIMMASEGAIADWSALYLKKVVLMKNHLLGFGYALFSMGMTLGRFTGDALSHRFGSWRLLRMAIGTSLIGFTLVLMVHPALALIGFFIIGIGFSIIVPEVYRLASNIKGIRTADGISFLAATTNVGFLTGPVLLGFIAEMHSLYVSFLILSVFVTTALVLSLIKK